MDKWFGTYLQVSTAKHTVVQNEGLVDKFRFRKLDICIPAYAH